MRTKVVGANFIILRTPRFVFMVKLGFDPLFNFLLYNCVIRCPKSSCCPIIGRLRVHSAAALHGGVSFVFCTLSCVLYATLGFIHTVRILQTCQVYYYLSGCYYDLVSVALGSFDWIIYGLLWRMLLRC
jgi:hypothetical protein